MATILVIEDDRRIGEHLRINFELRKYTVDLASNINEARGFLQNKRYDACLMDVELPDGNGIDFCHALRALDPHMPIIMVTAKIDEMSVIEALEAGADDYIRKPFSLKELAIRLDKILQKRTRLKTTIEFGNIKIDLDTRTASYAGSDLELGKKELEILQVFMMNPGRVFSREALLKLIDRENLLQGRTVDSHISHLRKKLSQAACVEAQIVSVYGEGYRLIKNEDV